MVRWRAAHPSDSIYAFELASADATLVRNSSWTAPRPMKPRMIKPSNGGASLALLIRITTLIFGFPCLNISGASSHLPSFSELDAFPQLPIGWGPYILDEWEAGKACTSSRTSITSVQEAIAKI